MNNKNNSVPISYLQAVLLQSTILYYNEYQLATMTAILLQSHKIFFK
jgi:hypothetical protein